jgi:ABC-type sulfate transport system permease subunit
MAMQQGPDNLSPREYETMNYEKEMFDRQAAYHLELTKYEAKWTSLLKLPVTIIRLPIYVVFAVAYCICVAKGKEPSENFWKLMR